MGWPSGHLPPELVCPRPFVPSVQLQALREAASPQSRAPAVTTADIGGCLTSGGSELNVSFPLADQGEKLVRPPTAFSHVPHAPRDHEMIFQRVSSARGRHPGHVRAVTLPLGIFSAAARGLALPPDALETKVPATFSSALWRQTGCNANPLFLLPLVAP